MGELINIKIVIKENINLKELIEKIKNELDTKNGYKLPIENPVKAGEI